MSAARVTARYGFVALSVASLLLLLATVYLWIQSWRNFGSPSEPAFGMNVSLTDINADPGWDFGSRIGTMVLARHAGDGGMEGSVADTGFSIPGFRYDAAHGTRGSWLFFTTSHRATCVMTSILPAIWLFTVLRNRRRRS